MGERRCYGCMKPKQDERICPHCGHDERLQNGENQLPIGTILKEQYVIGKVLGQGGFGITYMGWDMYLDIPVAIKEYYPNGSVMRNSRESTDVISYGGETGERFLHNKERFMKEVKMLARFSDVPEIVHVKTFFLANNTAYIVMEYIEGITLKEYVQMHGGRLDANTTFRLLKPVMEALSKVHESGLVHRDISPDNIMLTKDGIVKLLDFGAVRDVGVSNQDKSTEAIFKQGYAPIEQYRGRNIGAWTDVYAFCATIFFCLTGKVPPDAPDLLMGEELPKLSQQNCGVTPEMEAVLKKGMASRAEDRIQDMGSLCEQLFLGEVHRHEPADKKEQPLKPSKPQQAAESAQDGTRKETEDKRQKRLVGVVAAAMCVLMALALRRNMGMRAAEEESTPEAVVQKQEWQEETQQIQEELSAEVQEYLEAQVLEGQCGDQVYWSLDTADGVLVLEGSGPTWRYGDMEAEYAKEAGLVDYEASFYPYREYIREIIIGPEVSELGSFLFADCMNLESVDWGNIQVIHDCCFSGSGLVRVELPETVKYIYDYAFHYNLKLEEVVLPESLVELVFPFSATESLKTVIFKGNPVIWGQNRESGSIFYERENMHGSDDVVIYCGEDSLNVKAYAQQSGDAYVIMGD